MIIYVEYVIFDNFLLDLFIGVLVVKLLRLKSWRAFLSAFFGTVLALIYPLVSHEYIVIYKILTALMCCLPFVTNNLASLIKATFYYVIVAFIFNGLISLALNTVDEFGYYSTGGLVGLVTGGGMIGYIVIYKFINMLAKRLSNDKYVKMTVCIGDKTVKAVGFMDTGNIATASDGKGIVFLDKNLSKKINSDVIDYVFINTVGSGKIFNVIKIDKLMIYSGGEKHIYKNVNAVKTNQSYQGFQVLLSSNLKEVSA